MTDIENVFAPGNGITYAYSESVELPYCNKAGMDALAAKDARIADLEAAIKPFIQHGVAMGVYGGSDNGPYRYDTPTGYREVDPEDFRRARSTLEGKQPQEASGRAEASGAIIDHKSD
jgi:hypothetical protein